jgi:electron transfer flavoprotein alpha/beta subunit
VRGPLPALLTAAEDIAEERFPNKAERQAAATKPIATLSLAELGVDPSTVGSAGSPTWVAGIEQVAVARRGELLDATGGDVATMLRERLRALGALDVGGDDRPALPPAHAASGAPVWVVVETTATGLRAITFELLGKAAELAARLGTSVEAIAIGAGAEHAAALVAAGADRVLIADHPSLRPYTTEAHTKVLTDAIRARTPRLVLLGSTAIGRDLAPRVAGRLGLGLTGDAIDLELDDEGRTRQMKPAFGGTIVAPILSRTPTRDRDRPSGDAVGRAPGREPDDRDRPARRAGRVIAGAGRRDGARWPTGRRRRSIRPRLALGVGKGLGLDGVRPGRGAGGTPRRRARRDARGHRPRLAAATASGGAHRPRDRTATLRRPRGERRHGAHGRASPCRHHRRREQEPEGADLEARRSRCDRRR